MLVKDIIAIGGVALSSWPWQDGPNVEAPDAGARGKLCPPGRYGAG